MVQRPQTLKTREGTAVTSSNTDISDTQISELQNSDTKADLTESGGVLPTSQLPALSITSIDVVADQSSRLSLTAEEGDVAVQSDTGEAYILSDTDPTVDSNWVEVTIDVLSQINGQQITPAQLGASGSKTQVIGSEVSADEINFAELTSDPSAPSTGDMWYRGDKD